jgi:hypothetical protein
MKRIIIIFVICLFKQFGLAQDWQWAKKAGSVFLDYYSTVVHDNNDNLYTSGITKSSGAFKFYFGNDSISGSGYGHVIAKYDANGNEVWVRALRESNGGNGAGDIRIIYDKHSDAVIAIGVFSGTLTYDAISLNGGSSQSIYAAKFDNNGNCLWLKLVLASYIIFSDAADVDSSGNIFLYTSSSITYNGPTDTILAGGNIIKFDPDGNILWVKNRVDNVSVNLGASFRVYSLKIMNGKMYLSGGMANDTLMIDTITIISTNNYGLVLSEFDMNANVQWAKAYSSPGYNGLNMGLDANGNIYTIGDLYGVAHFGNDSVYNLSYPDGFLAKFDSLGNFIWARNISTSSGFAIVQCCSTSSEGGTYVAGIFKGTANFGSYQISVSDTNMFIARYDSSGNCLGVKNFGGAFALGVTILSDGSAVVCGEFTGTSTVGSYTLTSYGNYDAYITRLDEFTGIHEYGRTLDNQLLIYANPNAGKCNITVPDEFLHEKNLVLNIFDNTGKLIQQKTLEMNEGKIKLNLEAEAKGIYHVTLSNKNKSYSGKIVFE